MRPIADIERPAPPDLGKLRIAHTVEGSLADSDQADDVVIADGQRFDAVDHRTHGELRLLWHADLARDDEVERRAQGRRNLAGDRHAAARQGEHDRVLVAVVGQGRGKALPCLYPVNKRHCTPPEEVAARGL